MISRVRLVSPPMLATSTPPARYATVSTTKAWIDCWIFVQVNGYAADQLDQALKGVKVVVIPAGVPRKVCVS